MCDLFPIIKVPEDAILETEELGTKRKFWFDQSSSQMFIQTS